jgi:hypothetical protein
VTPVESLAAIRDGYLAALAADAASPQPDYEINQKRVGRDAWRRGMMELVMEANQMILMAAPYRVETIHRT